MHFAQRDIRSLWFVLQVSERTMLLKPVSITIFMSMLLTSKGIEVQNIVNAF